MTVTNNRLTFYFGWIQRYYGVLYFHFSIQNREMLYGLPFCSLLLVEPRSSEPQGKEDTNSHGGWSESVRQYIAHFNIFVIRNTDNELLNEYSRSNVEIEISICVTRVIDIIAVCEMWVLFNHVWRSNNQNDSNQPVIRVNWSESFPDQQ